MEDSFAVISGFGDYTQGLDTCDGVNVIRYFNSQRDAQVFAEEYYESDGLDADGFTVCPEMIQSWFVLVRPARNWSPLFAELRTLRDAGHAIYDGEPCTVTGDPDSCGSCALLSAHIG